MNKTFLSIIVGIVVMLLVFVGIKDSLTRPTLNRIPISNYTAVDIVKKFDDSLYDIPLSKIQTNYVFVKGDGSVYNVINNNKIDKMISLTKHTISTGNHFAWEVIIFPKNITYYIDHITGQVISSK